MYELLEHADDSPAPWICPVTTSGHLHVVRVDALDGLEGSRQIELRGDIVYNLP
jgi:hypothetical protein